MQILWEAYQWAKAAGEQEEKKGAEKSRRDGQPVTAVGAADGSSGRVDAGKSFLS